MQKRVKLDWIPRFDDRSLLYGITSQIPGYKPASKTWDCSQWLDQGKEGACVGFGIAHALASEPLQAKMNNTYAKENIYWEAQKNDEMEGGSYPGAVPVYEGTSVLSGVKVVKDLGWIESYYWSFGIEQLIVGVSQHGPAVLGLKWFSGMSNPNDRGYITPLGSLIGGHCTMCRGVNIEHEYFILRNSWGRKWGYDGECKISFEDMDYLLSQNGEAVFFDGLKMVEMKKWYQIWK